MTWRASFTTLAGPRRFARLAAGTTLLVLAAGCGSSSPAPAASSVATAAEPVQVTRVIEGDTLQLADGRRVRVLGIDSCDARTAGGQKARIQGAKQLANPGSQPVTLAREPGVDLDPTGMLLRYVQLNGADYGQRMIRYDHTGVSAGPPRQSAGPAYLAVVRALDTRSSDEEPPVARNCGGPAKRSSSSSSSTSTTTSSSEETDDSSADSSSADSSSADSSSADSSSADSSSADSSSADSSSADSSSAGASDEPDDSATSSNRRAGSSGDGG